ncbi:uncharacterized protein [Lepeophtheirus salmonis]|uniref:uncharacterized protein n=1 Tax=Lepeophtheirus salmonis TaxID=72036 RepID=UPI001AE760E3|nr:kinetochore protein Nuf2-like [Lepeophtheirus salmonis]
MSLQEILEKLTEIFDNRRFTKESLRHPNGVKEIYTLFLIDFNFSFREIPLDPLFNVKPQVLDILSGINCLLSLICHESEDLEFQLNDLIAPSLHRTSKFLWALCNYFIHSNNIFQHDNLIQVTIDKALEEKRHLGLEIDSYQSDIQAKRVSRGIEKHEMARENEDIKELGEILQRLSDETNEITKQNDHILNEIKEENLKYENKSQELSNLNLKKSFISLQDKIDTLRDVQSVNRSRKATLSVNLQTIEDKLSTFEIHLIKQLLDVTRELKKTVQEKKQYQMTVKEKRSNKEDVFSEIALKKRKKEENILKLKNEEIKWNKKKQMKMEELELYSKMVESRAQKNTEYEITLNDFQDRIENITSEILANNKDWHHSNGLCNHQYLLIMQAVNSFRECYQ